MSGPFAIHIIGAGRGGTSLLMGVLDYHTQCCIHFEEFSFRYLYGDEGGETAGDRISKFVTACEEQASKAPKLIWGHKTTSEHVLALRSVPSPSGNDPATLFVKAVARIPTVYILRDGRTCVPSKMRRSGADLPTAIHTWRFSVELLRRYRAANGPLYVMTMEALVADPEGELRNLCDFLRIGYEADMLKGTANPKMPREYQQGGFTPSSVDSDDAWHQSIAEDLRYCGYLS